MTLGTLEAPSAQAPPAGRALEQARARRHTRRVKRLRVTLPLVALLGSLMLTGAAVLPKLFPLEALAGLSLTADGLVMNSPSLSGHLGEGRRYAVGADRAIQSIFTPSRLSLEGVSAYLDLGDDGTLTITGERAAYDTNTEVLTAEGAVAQTSGGDVITLQSATLYLREERMSSDAPITIVSPKGEIRAGAIDITDSGALLRLTGGVSITIDPQTARQP